MQMILLIVAIQGRILQQGIINNANTVTRVEVLKVLKESKVQVKVNATVDLWTNSTCVCPRLIRNRTYLLIGYEDAVTQRLLFLDNCLAAKWKKKWVKRLKVSYCPFRFCNCCYIVSDHNPEYVNRVYKLYWFVTSICIPPPPFLMSHPQLALLVSVIRVITLSLIPSPWKRFVHFTFWPWFGTKWML